jgi:hypothetical protein
MMMAALTFILALFVPLVSAQTQQPAAGTQQPAAAAQDPAKEEYDAYAAWYAAYKAQDLAKSLELGRAFLAKFPSSKYADSIKKDNVRARGLLYSKAVQEKNMNEMIRRPIMRTKPTWQSSPDMPSASSSQARLRLRLKALLSTRTKRLHISTAHWLLLKTTTRIPTRLLNITWKWRSLSR